MVLMKGINELRSETFRQNNGSDKLEVCKLLAAKQTCKTLMFICFVKIVIMLYLEFKFKRRINKEKTSNEDISYQIGIL